MSNTISDQKIRNAIVKLAPSIKDHDAVLRGIVLRVRGRTDMFIGMNIAAEDAFNTAMADTAGEILGLETQLKAAR